MTTPATAARTKGEDSSHWYQWDGTPAYEQKKKTGPGMRSTTLADARDQNLVPSVTTILKILHKEALVRWMIEQACLAVLTTPRLVTDGKEEETDAFVVRVLKTEKVQEQETQIARDRGNNIHDAIAMVLNGGPLTEEEKLWLNEMLPWITPALEALKAYGKPLHVEKVIVGNGYAGRTDLVQDCDACWRLWDWKGTKNLPDPRKGAWPEHRLQLSAYGKGWEHERALQSPKDKPIITGNIYISTVNQGEFVICEHEDWQETFRTGFAPLVRHWQWANSYRPIDPNAAKVEAEPEIEEIPGVEEMEPTATVAEPAQPEKTPAPAPAEPATAAAVQPSAPGPNRPTSIGGRKVVWAEGIRTAVMVPPPPPAQ